MDVACAFNDDWTAALRYEGSREFKPEEIPERQYGAAVAWSLNRFTTWSVEYHYGEFDAEGVGERHLGTLQLALGF